MALLADLLGVFLQGAEFLTLALAVGGVFFALEVLRPWRPLTIMTRAALRQCMRLIVLGSVGLAIIQLFRLLLQFFALADGGGEVVLTHFLSTRFAQGGILRMGVALGMAAVAFIWVWRRPESLMGWITLTLISAGLMLAGAGLVHGASRIDKGTSLMAVTLLHQLAAAVWVGGILHLLALWRLIWGNLEVTFLWPQWIGRFSPAALLSVGILIAAGGYMAVEYMGSWQGLIGSGYGAMVLSKSLLLGLALILAAWNYFQLSQWRGRRAGGIFEQLPLLLSAEAWVLGVAMLGAAALTSLPPAVDAPEQQATFTEVIEHFTPTPPRLVPPSREEYFADAGSAFEGFALSGKTNQAQSEFNHNFAGAIVLAMALLALVDRSLYFIWNRHWPLLFLGLAVFLFLFAERDVWPLGPKSFWETLQVPAVLQHRLATLVVIGLGIFEWRVRLGKPMPPYAAYVFPWLCLLGGALLLTHSHTVFALKSEFLIEVHHSLLGVLAVVMGVGRRLELDLEAPEGKWAGWIWRLCFTLIGLLLLFYREPVVV